MDNYEWKMENEEWKISPQSVVSATQLPLLGGDRGVGFPRRSQEENYSLDYFANHQSFDCLINFFQYPINLFEDKLIFKTNNRNA